MHIHILGIGGTFMSALALLAREKSYTVTGNDRACYPPISDLLQQHDIQYESSYDDMRAMLAADVVIVGNALKRGMPIVECLLNHTKAYVSGPEWLAAEVLADYKVLAVAGTHGKTSTSTLVAYILQQMGLQPGYLIGGVPQVLPSSACLGQGSWFVIEADEYDTAFFDKRPKFMHYRPQGLILHNLEFDHADIYDSLAAIQRQFHYLLRTMSQQAWIVRPQQEEGIDAAMHLGAYSRVITWGETLESDVKIVDMNADGSQFELRVAGQNVVVQWSVLGRHNVENAIAAMLACAQLGVSYVDSARILSAYQPVKRRLELCYATADLSVYDDFAHHPTAIFKATQAVARSGRHRRLLAVLDFASNSMRQGEHLAAMPQALQEVDVLYVLNNPLFDLSEQAKLWPCSVQILPHVDALVVKIMQDIQGGDAILMMSNKGFEQLRSKLLHALQSCHHPS